jgi:RNA recognition motif-containing protein
VSSSIYVSNLPLSAGKESLAGAFAPFGTVLSVKLKRDPTMDTRCYGFVEMTTTEEARAACALNGTWFEGRLLSVWRAARS